MKDIINQLALRPMMKGGTRIAMLVMWFGIGMVVASVASMLIMKGGLSRESLLFGATVQDILLFMAPALLLGYTVSTKTLSYVGLSTPGKGRDYLYMLLIFIAVLPTLNTIIEWNANLTIKGMEPIVEWMRQMEDTAQAATDMMMKTTGIGGLIVNILVIGCLTGLSEELLFRGALQRTLLSCRMNPHIAIWISAVIFSLLHFQFFGFVPRVLIGVFLGYLLYWSGSLWVSATAHALNNSVVVVTYYLTENYGIDLESGIMSTLTGNPLAVSVSILLTAFLIYVYRKRN